MNKTLLIVDDEPHILSSLRRVLEDCDYEILTATSGAEGLTILANHSVQVVISDQRMPHMTGAEFFAQVKQSYPKTIRILLSAFTDFNAIRDAINEGAIYKFLNKPWEEDLLFKTIESAFIAYETQTKTKEMIHSETEAEVKRLQEEFLANMSHEIRTPLNGIVGFAEVLQSGVIDPLSPEFKEFLGDILQSSQLLSKLLANLMDFVQATPSAIDIKYEKINLKELITETLNQFTPELENRKIQCDVVMDESLQSIMTDVDKFQKAVYQYLSNAIKFSPEKSQISINGYMKDKKIYIEVKDNGIGIEEKDFGKIFKPFQQINMGMNKKYQGAGIGLALSKRLIELLGGTVGFKSQIGKGSLFFFILPIKQEEIK